jgi:hypothetical protein
VSRWSRWIVALRRRLLVLGPVAALLCTVVVELPASGASVGTVIAHRGDRAGAPENTLAAIRSAIFKGADAVEIDVRWSRDGIPVVLHDEGLGRTTNCAGLMTTWKIADLSGCDAGSWFDERFRGERVPTLRAALAEMALWSESALAIVHLKGFTDARQPGRIVETVAARGMADRTVFIADQPEILQQMRAAGADRLGFIFSWPGGWDWSFPYMIPQDYAFDGDLVRAAQTRGVTVWAIEGRPAGLTGLGTLAPIDGVLVNDLDSMRPTRPRQERDDRAELGSPGWSAASAESLSAEVADAGLADAEPAPAPRGRAVPLPADIPLPSSTFLSLGQRASAGRSAPAARADGIGEAAADDARHTDAEQEPAAQDPPARQTDSPKYVEPALLEPPPAYGPHPMPREGGWRPSGSLPGRGAALGS